MDLPQAGRQAEAGKQADRQAVETKLALDEPQAGYLHEKSQSPGAGCAEGAGAQLLALVLSYDINSNKQ